jgi:hypothetical protein
MSDNEAKDKSSEKVTLCNSKFQPGEPWPEDMFGEVETQMVQIEASAVQQPGAQAKGAALPVTPSDEHD